MDIHRHVSFFINLSARVYDIRDKERFKKIRKLIKLFFQRGEKEEIKSELNAQLPDSFVWNDYFNHSLAEAMNQFHSVNSKKQLNANMRFVQASVKLYYKVDEVFNRMDILSIAFIIRASEYDGYVRRMLSDLEKKSFNSEKNIRKYLINQVVQGNSVSLSDWGYWGDIESFLPDNETKNEENGDADNSPNEDEITIHAILRKRSKMVTLDQRIDWGSKKIWNLLNQYKKRYSHFYHHNR